VGPIAGDLDLLLPPRGGRIDVGRVIACHHDSAQADPLGLRPQERDGIGGVMQDESRHAGVERFSAPQVEERPLVEARAIAESGAASARAANHLAREIDPLHPVPRLEERFADETGTAARVEDPRAFRKSGEGNEPRERGGILLDRRLLESGGLSVERLRERAIVILHAGGVPQLQAAVFTDSRWSLSSSVTSSMSSVETATSSAGV